MRLDELGNAQNLVNILDIRENALLMFTYCLYNIHKIESSGDTNTTKIWQLMVRNVIRKQVTSGPHIPFLH